MERCVPFRAGIGLLAEKLQVPVVPMRIDGLFALQQAGKKFARPGTITVRIGQPACFVRGSDKGWITQELQKKIAEL